MVGEMLIQLHIACVYQLINTSSYYFSQVMIGMVWCC